MNKLFEYIDTLSIGGTIIIALGVFAFMFMIFIILWFLLHKELHN